jgi:HlyD family secretion protein
MTANVRIVVEHRESALKVPNAALRFRPAEATGAPPTRQARPSKPGVPAGRVWLLEAGRPKSIDVRLGLSDGASTELLGDPIAEGSEVIVGMAAADKRDSGLPRMRLF